MDTARQENPALRRRSPEGDNWRGSGFLASAFSGNFDRVPAWTRQRRDCFWSHQMRQVVPTESACNIKKHLLHHNKRMSKSVKFFNQLIKYALEFFNLLKLRRKPLFSLCYVLRLNEQLTFKKSSNLSNFSLFLSNLVHFFQFFQFFSIFFFQFLSILSIFKFFQIFSKFFKIFFPFCFENWILNWLPFQIVTENLKIHSRRQQQRRQFFHRPRLDSH